MNVEKSNLYVDCGLLGLIDAITSRKTLNYFPNFIELDSIKFDKEFWNTVKMANWVKVLENEDFSALNEEIKAKITDLLEKTDLWLEWLKILDKVLSDYWIHEKENTTLNGLKIQTYYQYIRTQCLTKYSELPEFAKEDVLSRLNRKNDSRQPQPTQRAICPHCGSSNTINHSPSRILCHDCGKTSMKSKIKQWIEETL